MNGGKSLNKENTQKLIDRFGMFRKNIDPTLPFPMFGIECGDGWFDLIWNLCLELEKLDDKNLAEIKDNKKAKHLLQGYSVGLEVHQVKEKFGSLRFYVSSSTNEMQGITNEMQGVINKAGGDSSYICELCGEDAIMCDSDKWIRTMCPDCANKDDKYSPREFGKEYAKNISPGLLKRYKNKNG